MTVASSSCRPGAASYLPKREPGVFERLEHAERFVEVNDEAGRNRIAAGFVGAHSTSLLAPSADVVDGRSSFEADDAADAVLEGTAAQLYLGLWNRGNEITETGPIGVLEQWRRMQRVRWS